MIVRFKKNFAIIVMTVLGFALAAAFNNCGKSDDSTSNPSLFDTYADKEAKLISQFHGKLVDGFCESSENYSCVHKIFSRQVDYADLGKSKIDCINLIQGGQICPEIQHYSYNSQSADSSCQQKENCQESYEFEDFDCHLKLAPISKVYPLVVSEDTLSAAVEKLHQSCVRINEGSEK